MERRFCAFLRRIFFTSRGGDSGSQVCMTASSSRLGQWGAWGRQPYNASRRPARSPRRPLRPAPTRARTPLGAWAGLFGGSCASRARALLRHGIAFEDARTRYETWGRLSLGYGPVGKTIILQLARLSRSTCSVRVIGTVLYKHKKSTSRVPVSHLSNTNATSIWCNPVPMQQKQQLQPNTNTIRVHTRQCSTGTT